MGARDISFAVNHDINGIGGGGVHGGEIGVLGEDDTAGARIQVEIFFYDFFGFTDVDSENEKILVGEFVADFFHKGSFHAAVSAPGRPEFEENDSTFDRGVGESFVGGGFGVEARGGLFGFGVCGECGEGDASTDEDYENRERNVLRTGLDRVSTEEYNTGGARCLRERLQLGRGL